MDVVYFERRSGHGHFSIEGYFAAVRTALPLWVRWRVCLCRFSSQGLWRRIYNIVEAFRRRGEVNHVTGDVNYLVFGLPRSRTVLTFHDCEPLERLRGLRRWLMLWLWYRGPAWWAAMLTANSETTKRELLRHVRVPHSKIRVVPVFVSPTFRPCPREFNVERPRIIQVGTSHNKNLPRLIVALEGVPCHLDIVGRLTSGQKAALERHGIEYSNAWGLSEAELLEHYEACDLVAFASTYEGFGMPILEANWVERPVVTSNVLSMPEVAGDAACLVDPYDVASIRGGILRVIGDAAYRDVLVANGRRNRLRYDGAAVAARYAEIYRELARPRRMEA